MNSTPSRYDAIVVGAGHNGLTAAAYLAKAGLRALVLERREIVGGCCVTEEIAPGCRASTTSYIASMLRPEVIRDLDLPSFGLRMVPCDPFLQVPFPDGRMIRWWADRERVAEEIKKFSARDAKTFLRVDDQLKKLARYLQPFFLEPPPHGPPGPVGSGRPIFRPMRSSDSSSGRESRPRYPRRPDKVKNLLFGSLRRPSSRARRSTGLPGYRSIGGTG